MHNITQVIMLLTKHWVTFLSHSFIYTVLISFTQVLQCNSQHSDFLLNSSGIDCCDYTGQNYSRTLTKRRSGLTIIVNVIITFITTSITVRIYLTRVEIWRAVVTCQANVVRGIGSSLVFIGGKLTVVLKYK